MTFVQLKFKMSQQIGFFYRLTNLKTTTTTTTNTSLQVVVATKDDAKDPNNQLS
jgi:hypothetical protein